MIKYKLGSGHYCFSFDDYHADNLKIADMFEKYNLRATFYIETRSGEAQDQIRELHKRGHEIGSHTIHHPGDLKSINSVECRSELEGSKRMIESITGVPCESFCYPRGRFNDDVVAMVKKSGYKEARTTHVLKTKSEDPFRMPTTLHIFQERKEYKDRPVEVLFDFYKDDVVKNGGVLSIWGHALELNRWNYWDMLEDMLKKLTV